MNNKTFIWAIIVAIVFLIGAFAYNKNQNKIQVQDERQHAIEQETVRPTETINVKYQFKNGRNIVVGSVMTPTPCHTMSAEIVKTADAHEIVILTKPSSEICAQVITERMFKVETQGAAAVDFLANLNATLNGEIVNLNIFEIPPTDDIDKIEIFIKG